MLDVITLTYALYHSTKELMILNQLSLWKLVKVCMKMLNNRYNGYYFTLCTKKLMSHSKMYVKEKYFNLIVCASVHFNRYFNKNHAHVYTVLADIFQRPRNKFHVFSGKSVDNIINLYLFG